MVVENTAAVDYALRAAGWAAHRQDAAAVEPGHVLQVLLTEEEGRPWLLLVEAGLRGDQVRAVFPRLSLRRAQSDSSLPLSDVLQQILRQARHLAREAAADGMLASHLLLLALLRQDAAARQAWRGSASFLPVSSRPSRRCGRRRSNWTSRCASTTPPSRSTAHHMLDAGANRAREALRVVEDYCRFVLDDAFLSEELKRLRHELTEILGNFPAQLLLESRETLRNMGHRTLDARGGSAAASATRSRAGQLQALAGSPAHPRGAGQAERRRARPGESRVCAIAPTRWSERPSGSGNAGTLARGTAVLAADGFAC